METARSQIRKPLVKFILRLQKLQVGVKITTGFVHALREFAVACFELGRKDLYEASTLPAPRKQQESDPPAGTYSLSGRKPDKV